MTSNQFGLWSTSGPDGVVVRACGRLSLGHGAADDLWEPLVRDARGVTLDLTGVTELDARGVGVLAALAARARQTGATLTIAGASRAASSVAQVVRLDQILPGAWNNPFVVRHPHSPVVRLRREQYARGHRRQVPWANPTDQKPHCSPLSTTS